MTNEVGQIRQGDVLLMPVNKQPPSGLQTAAEAVLALGEVSGHAHRLRGTVLDWMEPDGNRYVRVLDKPGELSHEEHDPTPVAIVVPEQTYQVVPQHEWDLSGQWKKVID